jgi:hypothetical protein
VRQAVLDVKAEAAVRPPPLVQPPQDGAGDRPQDAADLRLLLEAAQPFEMEAAREAVSLIESRGFYRSTDLAEALKQARREFGAEARQ